MTVWAATANGNLTTSTTWKSCDTTSYSNSESAQTALTTSQVASSTFTPGAITIDGFAVKIANRAASPSGTMTVQLFDSTASSVVAQVTVNVSDVPLCSATSGTTTPVYTAEGGWFFVNIGSTTLTAGHNYAIRGATSVASEVNLWSTATTNWSRYLRTTTTGAPAAGDDLIITGEWTAAATVTARTVTMNSTSATAYGSNTTSQVTPSCSICNNGTLQYGTSASTAYILNQLGYMVVYAGGTLNIGTSGTPMPQGSTGLLEFQCTNQGDFGLVVRNLGTVNMYGSPRTAGDIVSWTYLTADASAGATSLTVAATTGWLSGDSICIAPTTQTYSQYDKVALTGNASGTSLTVGATTYAHLGTFSTYAAAVGLLTHNVVMTSQATAKQTFFFIGLTSTVNCQWTEFSFLGWNNTQGKRAIEVCTTTGTANFQYCSNHDSYAQVCLYSASNGVCGGYTWNQSVAYNILIGIYIPQQFSSGTWTMTNSMMCAITSNSAVYTSDNGGTIQNSDISGCAQTSTQGTIYILDNRVARVLVFSGNNMHSNNTQAIDTGMPFLTCTNCNFWRNASEAIELTQSVTYTATLFTFTNCNFYGNTSGIYANYNGSEISMVIDTCNFNSDTTYTSNQAVYCQPGIGGVIRMYSCNMSKASGILTAQTVDVNLGGSVSGDYNNLLYILDNCYLNAATPINHSNNAVQGTTQVVAQNYNNTANDNRSWVSNGTVTPGIIQTNNSTFRTSAPSCQLTPNSATYKLPSGLLYVPVNSGSTATFSIYVNVNGTYNGNAPRLILQRQDSMGVTSNVVCATWSGSTGTWVKLTYTTGTAPQNGVYAFYVDCDGTAGSVFIDDATPY